MQGPDTLSAMLLALSDEIRLDFITGEGLSRERAGALGRTLRACAIAARNLEEAAAVPRLPAVLPENVIPMRRRTR